MTREHWNLLVISAAHGEPISPVQLQKALFLIAENLSPAQRQTESFYSFTPYDYGPFDSTVYSDAEGLARDGFVFINNQRNPREYVVTPLGGQLAGELRKALSPDVREYLDTVVKWVRSLSFNELVRAIYAQYPQMREKSVFRG